MNKTIQIVITLPAEGLDLPRDIEKLHYVVSEAVEQLRSGRSELEKDSSSDCNSERIAETLDRIHDIAYECRTLLEDCLESVEEIADDLDDGVCPYDR